MDPVDKMVQKDVKKLEQELESVNSHLTLLRSEFVKVKVTNQAQTLLNLSLILGTCIEGSLFWTDKSAKNEM